MLCDYNSTNPQGCWSAVDVLPMLYPINHLLPVGRHMAAIIAVFRAYVKCGIVTDCSQDLRAEAGRIVKVNIFSGRMYRKAVKKGPLDRAGVNVDLGSELADGNHLAALVVYDKGKRPIFQGVCIVPVVPWLWCAIEERVLLGIKGPAAD
ncbi:hypothetical protein PG990_003645 [Apiospora arundinis]|uniref:Uncharacterized protein n=1 Tax=Apiospora arundinis TaxID=335852 RepID=A0ABR2IFH7_9PEZI